MLRYSVFASVLITMASAAAADSRYRLVDLGSGDAYAINEKRQVLIYVTNVPTVQFVVWDKGRTTPLPADAFGQGINDEGQVTGSYSPTGFPQPFLWDRGGLKLLGVPQGAWFGKALALNNKGQIVGWFNDRSAVLRPFVWQKGVFTELPTGGHSGSEVRAISEDGLMAGYVMLNGLQEPVVWAHGRLIELGLPEGIFGGSATGINDRGMVTVLTGPYGYVWERGTYRKLDRTVGERATPLAINASGSITGSHSSLAGTFAAVWDRDTVTDLPTLGGRSEGRAINNHGDVAGYSLDAAGQSHAVLWLRTGGESEDRQ